MRGDVASNMKDLLKVQEMKHKWSNSFCNRKRKKGDQNDMPSLPSPSIVQVVLLGQQGYENYIRMIEYECPSLSKQEDYE